jgi:hydrogenase nickel incorporation protein HypB
VHRTKVRIVEDALDANNTIASANRADFDRAGVKVVNFMSAPGAGKTTLLERVVTDLPGVRVGVLEGDVEGSMDADRLAHLHIPVTQLNTGAGFGGECHPTRTWCARRSPRSRSTTSICCSSRTSAISCARPSSGLERTRA